MLSQEIKDILLEIKFRENVFPLFDTIAAEHNADVFISSNAFQPDSRLGKPYGVVFTVHQEKVADIKSALDDQLPEMYSYYEIGFTEPHIHLAIIRPTDKYELLRIMGTNSEQKHNLDTGTLLARLRRWENEYGLQIVGAGADWIKVKIEKTPGELREFVTEISEFAPGTMAKYEINDLETSVMGSEPITISW